VLAHVEMMVTWAVEDLATFRGAEFKAAFENERKASETRVTYFALPRWLHGGETAEPDTFSIVVSRET
jgi:hypothetical protein